MDCEIDYYRTSDTGAQEKYMTILLRNASIINFSQNHANALMQNDVLPSETLTIRYESITCNHIMASTSGYSIASVIWYRLLAGNISQQIILLCWVNNTPINISWKRNYCI